MAKKTDTAVKPQDKAAPAKAKAQDQAKDQPQAKAQPKPQQKGQQKDQAKPNPFKRFAAYVEDSKAELRKVTWPNAAETRKATFAVLGFVAVMALLLGLIDLGLSSLIQSILS
jgi:preprotein translocase subunit SecE